MSESKHCPVHSPTRLGESVVTVNRSLINGRTTTLSIHIGLIATKF